MQILEPKVNIWLQNNISDHVARCARVCYASVPKSTGNEGFCTALWANKHRSMFRHAGVYYITPDISKVNKKAFIGAEYVFLMENIMFLLMLNLLENIGTNVILIIKLVYQKQKIMLYLRNINFFDILYV